MDKQKEQMLRQQLINVQIEERGMMKVFESVKKEILMSRDTVAAISQQLQELQAPQEDEKSEPKTKEVEKELKKVPLEDKKTA